MILAAIFIATTLLAITIAPQAHSDILCVDDVTQCPWGATLVPPDLSVAASIDANQPRNYPPAGPTGTMRVYVTPPGTNIKPSVDNFCGLTTSPAVIPATCPKGDVWVQ